MPSEIVSIRFRSYCDTFWDLDSTRDENIRECRQSWICSKDQFRCHTGQCVTNPWEDDFEWDCADAEDEYRHLNFVTNWALRRAYRHDFTNRSYFVPSHCNESYPFLCLSAKATRQGFECFNRSQIGDGRIDCAGGMDERNTLRHCSDRSSMLGYHFLCPSMNICIDYFVHCFDGHRCPNRSDDELWCSRQRQQSSNCSDQRDFVCFDGQCVKGGRCNAHLQCSFGEDEYMCDYRSSRLGTSIFHREGKRSSARMKKSTIELGGYPLDANISELEFDSPSSVVPSFNSLTDNSSLSPYWCNRGVGVVLTNASTLICFCPPQYYGEKCQFHSDRLSIVLGWNVADWNDSSRVDRSMVVQVVVLLLFENEMSMSSRVHLVDSSSMSTTKLKSDFPYPRSSSFLHERRERFFNRSSIVNLRPFSIRIELYRSRCAEQPSRISRWTFPLSFSHLPVFRFAKVLHLRESSWSRTTIDKNTSARLSLGNNSSTRESRSKEEEEEEEEDPQCATGYCSVGSVCRPTSPRSFGHDSSPLCLCPLNRIGQRCSIEHSACLSNPCRNNGSCLPNKEADQFFCLCEEGFIGSLCQSKRASVRLSLHTDLPFAAALIQHFRIDFTSLHLIIRHQQLFRTLPQLIQSDPTDQKTIPHIIFAKLYSDDHERSPDLHRSNDFVCLCPSCYSGRQCQFNTKSFSFTLDQLFSPDLLSDQRRTTTISLLLVFSLFTFFLALPNNLFSLITLRRRSCLRYGVGHYLLTMSIINQLSLTLLLARLLHLILNITGTSSLSSTTNDHLCKSLNYLLSSSTRMVYWLTSLISIERLYTTLFLRGQWLKQPHIARRLILLTFVTVFISDLYELFFYKSFSTQTDEQSHGSICVLDISSEDRRMWTTFHLLFLILHSLLPFLINLFSTITICLININKKIKTSVSGIDHTAASSSRFSERATVFVNEERRNQSTNKNTPTRKRKGAERGCRKMERVSIERHQGGCP